MVVDHLREEESDDWRCKEWQDIQDHHVNYVEEKDASYILREIDATQISVQWLEDLLHQDNMDTTRRS